MNQAIPKPQNKTQPKAKPAIQSKTLRFNVVGFLVSLAALFASDEFLALLEFIPEEYQRPAMAGLVVLVFVANIWLRLVTGEPIKLPPLMGEK